MVKTRTWVMMISLLLAVSLGLCLWLSGRRAEGTVANIYKDGELIRSVDLSLVEEPYEFTVEDELGSNTIRVEPGRIRVVEADCPDGICVSDGWLSDSAAPIVCLPHRLVIRLEKSGVADAAAPDAISR